MPKAFIHHGYCLVRQPLLTLEQFELVKHNISELDGSPLEQIRYFLNNPQIELAVKIGAPAFARRMQALLETGEATVADAGAFFKYVTRMSTRATPFACFATVFFAPIEWRNSVNQQGVLRCRIRLDSAVLNGIHETIRKSILVDDALRVRLNPTVYLVGDRMRYYEKSFSAGRYNFALASADLSPFLKIVIDALTVPLTLGEIIIVLQSFESDLSTEEIREYLAELLTAGVIEIDLHVGFTGGAPLNRYLQSLRKLGRVELAEQEQWLGGLASRLSVCEQYSMSETVNVIGAVARQLQELNSDIKIDNVCHVDAFRPVGGVRLHNDLLSQVQRTVQTLSGLLPPMRNSLLDQFAESFVRRFGEEFVPLLEALDPETGIEVGFSASVIHWVQGIRLQHAVSKSKRMLSDVLLDSLHFGVENDVDLAGVTNADRNDKRPRAFSANLTLYTPDSDIAPLAFLHDLNSPSASSLMTRFAAEDKSGGEYIARSLQMESLDYSGAIMAEIIHTPQPRSGNVLARPDVFKYSIVLSGSAPPNSEVIPLNDILVGVENGRVALHSASSGREIIPRLTSAYNYFSRGNLGIYQFLCALGQQDQMPSFRWPASMATAKRLPRVRCGRIVLAAKRWRFDLAESKNIKKWILSDELHRARDYLFAHGLPRFVTLDEGDQRLEIDLESNLSLQMLGNATRKIEFILLHESVVRIGRTALTLGEMPIHSEVILPLTIGDNSQPSVETNLCQISGIAREGGGPAKNAHAPMWEYVRVYGGEEVLARVFSQDVARILNAALEYREIIDWHFVRYRDPDFHFRLRLLGEGVAVRDVLQKLNSLVFYPLISAQRLVGIRSDIYVPEVRRYGGRPLLSVAEKIFTLDSQYAAAVLELKAELPTDDILWKSVLAAIIQNLELFYDRSDSLKFIRSERDGYGREFDISGTVHAEIGRRYRMEKASIEAAVVDPMGIDPQLNALLARRANRLRILVDALDCKLEDLPRSFISGVTHMMANRIFVSPSRFQEYLVFDFLDRAYRSLIARKKGT